MENLLTTALITGDTNGVKDLVENNGIDVNKNINFHGYQRTPLSLVDYNDLKTYEYLIGIGLNCYSKCLNLNIYKTK